MSPDESGNWVSRDIDGKPVRVRAGGFADQVFQSLIGSRERAVEAGRMEWTIGHLADLCWMIVPESRSGIAQLLCAEIVSAVDRDRFLSSPTFSEISEVLCDTLIAALEDPEGSRDVAFRCLDVMRRAIEEKGEDYRGVFGEDIVGPIKRRGLWSACQEVHPGLMQLMSNAPEWRGLLDSGAP